MANYVDREKAMERAKASSHYFEVMSILTDVPRVEPLEMLMAFLPALDDPRAGDVKVWKSSESILCKTEELANAVADFLEALGYDCPVTGNYDLKEAAVDGLVDQFTGLYYVSV